MTEASKRHSREALAKAIRESRATYVQGTPETYPLAELRGLTILDAEALYEQLEAAHKAVEDADADAQNAYVIASNVWREEYDKLKEQLEAAVAQIRLQHAALAAHGGGPCICEWCASTPASRDEA